VVLLGLLQEGGQGAASEPKSDHSRPGSRVVTSCSTQPLPSGSLNDAYEQ
jgi:hypothetical protein